MAGIPDRLFSRLHLMTGSINQDHVRLGMCGRVSCNKLESGGEHMPYRQALLVMVNVAGAGSDACHKCFLTGTGCCWYTGFSCAIKHLSR